MKQLEAEVDHNFDRFCKAYMDAAMTTAAALRAHLDKYRESYRRLVSLQAWRSELLEKTISPDSLAFFVEAQNDALISHVLASFGEWRSSLKALRSCIENVCFSMYYKDHPVELQLWHSGRHKMNYSELASYFSAHPAFAGLQPQVTGLQRMGAEFSELSRAVHASAKGFRMSVQGIGVQLWSSDPRRLGAWGTREGQVLTALNFFLITIYREQLQGNQLANLRKAISLAIPATKHSTIRSRFKVTLFKRQL